MLLDFAKEVIIPGILKMFEFSVQKLTNNEI